MAWIETALSAGLWIASAAGLTYATPGAAVGSVGTRQFVCLKGRPVLVEHPDGKTKDPPDCAPEFLDLDATPENLAALQASTEAAAAEFVATLTKHRGVTPEYLRERWGGARIGTAEEAATGPLPRLIDGICSGGTAREALTYLMSTTTPSTTTPKGA
ncbi:MAG: hypothetical protein P1P84_01370 [Deferrisomatales bacterium]|nr:hypothetical protein [Deferrisomatales bacterium]